MSAPRCSLPDIIGSEDMLRRKRRRKRYALSGLKWHKTDLTWRRVSCHTLVVIAQTHLLQIVINNSSQWLFFTLLNVSQTKVLLSLFFNSVHSYPSASLSPGLPDSLVDSILSHAFKAWSDAAPLNFRRVSTDNKGEAAGGDIRVSFNRLFHDDGYPFDGQGGTLAHAFFPGRGEVAGDTHFDDQEIWSYGGGY